jgi:hypothetical protein
MGVKQSPDVAQKIMEHLLQDLDKADVYIDDVGIVSNSWNKHFTSLREVLTILQSANFTIYPLKCEWAVQETDWLGYWLTPIGLKPWRKKIDAIIHQHPTASNCQTVEIFYQCSNLHVSEMFAYFSTTS